MKKIYRQWTKVLLGLCCSVWLNASIAGTAPVVPVAAHQQQFMIRLPANPTTGFMWSVGKYDTRLIKLVRRKYRPVQNHMIGAGGVMDFYFVCKPGVVRPQHTDVEMVYARPWEKGSGTMTKVVVVFTK